MIIETMNGKIVNAQLIVKYMWCGSDGAPRKGGSGNHSLTAFFEDGEYICLGVFHSSTNGTVPGECERAWHELKEALKDEMAYYKVG